MPGEREDAFNDLTGTDPAGSNTNDDAAHVEVGRENGTGNEGGTTGGDITAKPDAAKPNAEPTGALAGQTAAAFLDSLSEPDPNADKRGADGKFKAATKEGEKPAGKTAADPSTLVDPKAATTVIPPKTPDPDADALIKELGVKSPRGQERIREFISKAKEGEEAKALATSLESDINEFRTIVQSTGMAPDEFAEMLHLGKLIKSTNEADNRLALEAMNAQRDLLAKKLGIEVPGVDALSDFPDLQKKVENLEITKETALELAKFKRQERAQQQQREAQDRTQQDEQAWQTKIADVTKTAQAYFATRATETDAPAKFARVKAYFADPKNVQELITTFTPEQWFGQIKFLYDNLRPAEAATRQNEQPMRGRPSLTGKPDTGAIVDNTARLGQHIDNMGI